MKDKNRLIIIEDPSKAGGVKLENEFREKSDPNFNKSLKSLNNEQKS